MVEENIIIFKMDYMMDNGSMEKCQDLENYIIKTILLHTKEIGKKICFMEKVYYIISIQLFYKKNINIRIWNKHKNFGRYMKVIKFY